MKNRILQIGMLFTFSVLLFSFGLLIERENMESYEAQMITPYALPNYSAGAIVVGEPKLEDEKPKSIGYVTANVNVRQEPCVNSSILEVLKFNQYIEYRDFNSEWAEITYKEDVAYIYKTYISKTINTYREFIVPESTGFKSFEPYDRFNPKYKQYQLQQYAYTDENGLRIVDERYCIALGTYYFENLTNDVIGTYVDLVLENGEIIQCILGDIKDDRHTDENNIITTKNGCLSEFIVDKNQLSRDARVMGDISYVKDEWKSPVEKVIIYEKNFFYE